MFDHFGRTDEDMDEHIDGVQKKDEEKDGVEEKDVVEKKDGVLESSDDE